MSRISVQFNLDETAMGYLESCCRIRGISTTRLFQRLIRVISRDQLVLSILDDESAPARQLPGEEARSHFRITNKDFY